MTARGPGLAEAVLVRAGSAGNHPAIVHRDQALSYRQLAASVEAFAEVIAALPGRSPVAVQATRSPSTIAAMLAILLAGRAYLPLNPADPPARQRAILAAADARQLVGGPAVRGAHGDSQLVLDPPAFDQPPRQPAAGRCRPRHGEPADSELAYIFFTSGSTGSPKGVPISRRNAEAFAGWASETFALSAADRIGVYAPLFFDLSIFDVFAGLRSGATLVLVPDDEAKFSRASLDYLQAGEITVLYTVPSALLALLASATGPAALPGLRLLLLAGEAFPSGQLDALREAAPHARLHNLYGPIESNVVAHFPVPADWPVGRAVPIGAAASGASLGLLDPDARADAALLDQPDAVGELVIAGPSVFTGYLPAGVAPPDPFVQVEGRRWYRTGDLASLGTDGQYRFHGRRDSRIKSRGFLVEPAEVEQALASHPQLSSAAVVAVTDPSGPALHAFAVPAPGAPAVTVRELRRWLGQLLPRYMWPAEIHLVTELPLGRTGKLDRQRLAKSVGSKSVGSASVESMR